MVSTSHPFYGNGLLYQLKELNNVNWHMLCVIFKVRYHLDEDPKTLKVFPIPLHAANGTTLHYDRLSLSPDGKILAATHGSTLQWLSAESGQVLDTAERSHDGIVHYSTSFIHFMLYFFKKIHSYIPFLVIYFLSDSLEFNSSG